MSVGPAVREALDHTAREHTAYLTLTQINERLGGTRATAAELGVSQRAVQRYLKAERGEPGQVRRPGRAVQPRLYRVRERESRRHVARRIRQHGLVADATGATVSIGGEYSRTRASIRTIALDPETLADIDDELLDDLARAYEEEDEDALGAAFDQAFFGAWGQGRMSGFQLDDVSELDITIPED